jgi:4-aminobutyrate--pyruvate transaminase
LLLPRGRSLPPTYHTFNHRSNDPCADVAKQIAELSPIPGRKVFLVNSGSEANDRMVKLAWY